MTLDEWMIFRSTGQSSRTMWAVFKGLINEGNRHDTRFSIPYDFGDFARCHSLWEECGITKGQLETLADTLPEWGPFVDNWDELCDRHLHRRPDNWQFIRNLVIQSSDIKSGLRNFQNYPDI